MVTAAAVVVGTIQAVEVGVWVWVEVVATTLVVEVEVVVVGILLTWPCMPPVPGEDTTTLLIQLVRYIYINNSHHIVATQ